MMMFPFISSIELQLLASARRDGDWNLQLQELIARLQLQELLNVYYTTHCRSLAGERVIAGAQGLTAVLHKLISLSMINKVLHDNRVLIFAMQ